nr:hypothetical protein CFP56_15092 [Quercus suber]
MNESATATAHHPPPSDNLPLSSGFGKEYWRSIQIFATLFEFVIYLETSDGEGDVTTVEPSMLKRLSFVNDLRAAKTSPAMKKKLCYVIVIGYTYMEYQKTTKILYATSLEGDSSD